MIEIKEWTWKAIPKKEMTAKTITCPYCGVRVQAGSTTRIVDTATGAIKYQIHKSFSNWKFLSSCQQLPGFISGTPFLKRQYSWQFGKIVCTLWTAGKNGYFCSLLISGNPVGFLCPNKAATKTQPLNAFHHAFNSFTNDCCL